MPQSGRVWIITPEELRSWILHEDGDLLVVNKPGVVVCHPSKQGPWSSLIGACREFTGLSRLHMPSRLDRETSGVVVLAKNAETGSRVQRAIQHRQVKKTYHGILQGELREAITVDQPIGRAEGAKVYARQAVIAGGAAARTDFLPLASAGGFTLVRITPHTGRMHQIRVHAQWLGTPVAGDKIYGADETLFLDFVAHGWTEELASALLLPRHALHASVWTCEQEGNGLHFEAPLPEDMLRFLERIGLGTLPDL